MLARQGKSYPTNHRSSTGHSFRRRKRPVSSNRGLRSYVKPSFGLRPIGTK